MTRITRHSTEVHDPKVLLAETPTEQLAAILWDMDIPDSRRELKPEDLLWLSRNLGINNSEHKKFRSAMRLISLCIKETT